MINRVGMVSFTGRIIDSHVHTGKWRVNNGIYDYGNDVDTFVKQPLRNGDTVEKVIASNLDCMVHTSNWGEPIKFASDEIKGNTDLLKLTENNLKIVPLATCQAGYGSVNNIVELFDNNPNKFVGLKFHPEQLQIPADNECYKPYLEFAQKKNLPCLFHSGQSFDVHYADGGISTASKFSRPEQIYSLAKQYPKVPVILAHMGGNSGENTMKAIDCIISSVKNNDAKLYADISWVDCDNPEKPTLKLAIQKLKEENALDRIMFGSDAPLGRFGHNGENGVSPKDAYTNNIQNIKTMINREFPNDAEEITEKLFYKNANDLFFNKQKELQRKTVSKGKVAAAVAIGIAVITGIGLYLTKKGNS